MSSHHCSFIISLITLGRNGVNNIMETFSQMLQLLFSGLTIGAIYALIAVGFVVIYNVTGILNFAQGEFAMFGALISISLVKANVPLWLAIILSIVIVAAIGGVFERTAIHTARKSSMGNASSNITTIYG